MNLFKLFIISLFISANFAACKKESTQQAEPPSATPSTKPAPGFNSAIQGLWAGHSVLTNKSIPAYFSFKIKDEGKLEVLNATQQVIGTGSWTFNGETFKTSYSITATGKAYSAAAGYFDSPGKLSGTWGFNSADNGGGFWEMDKIN